MQVVLMRRRPIPPVVDVQLGLGDAQQPVQYREHARHLGLAGDPRRGFGAPCLFFGVKFEGSLGPTF